VQLSESLSGFAKEALLRLYQQRSEKIPYVPVLDKEAPYKEGRIRLTTARELAELGLGGWVGTGEHLFRLTVSGRELAAELLAERELTAVAS